MTKLDRLESQIKRNCKAAGGNAYLSMVSVDYDTNGYKAWVDVSHGRQGDNERIEASFPTKEEATAWADNTIREHGGDGSVPIIICSF